MTIVIGIIRLLQLATISKAQAYQFPKATYMNDGISAA